MKGFVGQNMGRSGEILTPNELVIPSGGAYVCADFGKNRSRNARVKECSQMDRQTYCTNLLHAKIVKTTLTGTAARSATQLRHALVIPRLHYLKLGKKKKKYG